MNFEQAVYLLQTQIDWESFFALRSITKDKMNKESERFFKSRVVEEGLCSFSNGILSYIDEPGRDCQFIDYPNFFLEIKGNKNDWHLKKFATFRLVNGNSKKKIYSKLPETYAQFCLFHNLENSFLCESSMLNKYMINKDSGNIDVKVPVSELTLLGKKEKSSDKKVNSLKVNILSDCIDSALKEFYASIKNI